MLHLNLAGAESGPEPRSNRERWLCFGHLLFSKARVSDKCKARGKEITIGPKKPLVIPVLRHLWDCSVRDGVRSQRSCALGARLKANRASGEARLCYVQSPHDINHQLQFKLVPCGAESAPKLKVVDEEFIHIPAAPPVLVFCSHNVPFLSIPQCRVGN